MKNITPLRAALGASIAISLVFSLSIIAVIFLFKIKISVFIISTSTIYIFLLSFFLIFNTIEVFIYRRIKLIYKIISKAKYTKDLTALRTDMSRNILVDVEEDVIKSISNEIKESEQLKILEDYRKQFLGNVSHELKTPIFNIQGYLEALIDGGLKDDTINLNYLNRAVSNVARMTHIVSDLEMISSIEDGKLHLEIEKFNMTELINETIDFFSLIAKKADVEVKMKKGSLGSCIVKADRNRMRQVVVNLLSNAINYNKPGGKVAIGLYDMDLKILVEVSDTGIGIPNESIPRIFERFFRVSKSRSREKGGTGLGLAIVKHIIEAHKQTINVRSELGAGTTFSFTLDT